MLAGLLCSPAWLPLPFVARAAAPAAGTIGPSGPTLNWTGTAIGGASAGEDTCEEGVNCDTYTLNVSGTPADWTGKVISIKIAWTNPANDYDLYVHKDSNAGPIVGQSGDGAPDTEESTAISPSSTGTGVYTVHVVYFSVTPLVDQYQGTASVEATTVGRSASYVKGGIAFSPNYTVRAPAAARDGEPSNRTDKFGNHYTGAIRGVPAGVDLWYFDLQPGSPTYDPKMRRPIYRGQPDSFTQDDATSVGADGGGDIDLAVGFDSPASGQPPVLAYSSLVAANISTGKSTNKGQSFQLNPLGNVTGGAPGDDRQWNEFHGNNTVYLLYRTLAPAVTMIQRSVDGGFTYGPAKTAGAIGQVGSIDVHQASGAVYISGSTGQVCVGTPPAPGLEPLTYACNVAASDPGGVANIFFVVKVADDGTPNGTAYVTYSNGKDIFLAHSTDKGATWSQPVRVSDGPETRTSLLPWIETGPTPGSVGVVWYGTSEATNNDNANWEVFYAQSFNASSPAPVFRQAKVSDHFIHGSNISTGGTLGTANRNLLDYFQLSFDPKGAAVVSYTDDHNDFDGHTFVARQTSGPSIKGGTVPAPVEGAALPAPTPYSTDGSQVADFRQDVTTGLLAVTPTDDPLDILSIKYSCETSNAGPVLVAKMKVSDLSTLPPLSNWRMNFTANAPFSQLSPTGDYSFGLSDRGDQFWVRASTDPSQQSTFSFGTATRNSDGTITYTRRGDADGGSFDTAAGTITVKVALSKLNPFVTKGPAIGVGSVLAGLRGQTFTSGANAKRDLTRGGLQYTVGNCAGDSGGGGGGGGGNGDGNGDGNVVRVTAGGSINQKAQSFNFRIDNNFDGVPSGHLKYDANGPGGFRLVSDGFFTFMQTGPGEVTITGRGSIGSMQVTFTLRIQDNGEPGIGNDFFRIEISNGHTAEGRLSQGNIQFHR
ncbi:MAG: glycoside hydrolase [Acidobacteriota bacterium]|nr:glycoside hydrolase [Acidobacteriota bacterium]